MNKKTQEILRSLHLLAGLMVLSLVILAWMYYFSFSSASIEQDSFVGDVWCMTVADEFGVTTFCSDKAGFDCPKKDGSVTNCFIVIVEDEYYKTWVYRKGDVQDESEFVKLEHIENEGVVS